MRPVNRIQPKLPAHLVTTYTVAQPVDTHSRPAACGEVGCAAQASGWETLVNESTDLGARQAHYIRTQSGRHFVESRAAGVTTFRFPPGEQCFAQHRVSLDRPQLHIVRGGDHRGNPTGMYREHSSGDAWVDDFSTHLESIAKAVE